MRVSSLPKMAAKLLGQRKRRSWIGTERAHVEFRDVPAEDLERFTRHVRDAVGKLEHARWVEVNPHTRRVVIAFRESAYSLAALERVVEEAERAARIEQADFGDDRREHPADTEPEERLLVELAGDLTGFLVGGALRWSLFSPSSMAQNATALMSVLRASPRLRRSLDERLGPRRAELVLNLSLALTQGFAQRPVSSLVDMVHKRSLLREVRARRQIWEQREAELCVEPTEHHAADTRPDARPVPLPRGPIEEYADRAWIVSLGGFGVSFLTTRSFQRAVAALFGALPKPARFGRDVFASELGRELADRGVLILDPDVLRKLDRIDCLVLQGDLVARDLFRVGEVATTGAVSEARAREITEHLFDADEPIAIHRHDEFSLGPVRRLNAELAPELAARASELGRRGALVMGLARAGAVVAVMEVHVVPRTGIAELIASARAAQMRVVVATGDESVLHGLSADDVIGDSEGLASGIRRLQREGRGVCLVATGSSRALPNADCGIGLMREGDAVPWGAHLICGEDLSDVRFVLEACVSARKIAKQSVNIALGAATLGAVVSAGGLLPMTTRRVIAVVNAATLLSMSNGLRSSAALARRALPAPRDRTPWHALDAEGVLARLESSGESGLSRRVALERGEPREADKSALVELSDAVTDELFNPLAPLLAAGAGISAVVGSVADASMVGGVVVLNAVIGGIQRFRTERAIRELSRTARRRAVVRRNGQLSEVEGSELVPGDVVLLGPGDVVPADCRVVEAESLEVDASSLTGESLPVPKSAAPSFETEVADRSSMLYEGTSIAAGRATAVVVAVGEETEARRGAIASGPNPVTSGVEQRLRSLIDLTAPVALGAGVGLVGAGLLRGRRLEELVGAGVSLAVASVPEGLPLLATAAQLASAERLSRRGALVRNARSIEALGRVDVLCVDKTGTVTEGRLELSHVSDGSVEQPATELGRELFGVLAAAVRATPDPHGPGRADPTDAALVRAAEHLDIGARLDAETWTRSSELSFEAGRSYHAVLGLLSDGSRLSVKGAPEAILPECTHWQRGEQSTDLDGELRRTLAARAERLARRGLRVLCVAERSASGDEPLDLGRLARLTFRGFLAFSDPVRPSAARALERLGEAGVQTLMVTGDHPSTAEAIATDLGLLGGKRVLTGAELAQLSDEELDQKLGGVSVFARVTPAQKVRVVRALQRAGRVVAMVGDGANDAPAIRLANVGVAIGEHSTAAARGAADVVLTDERIETLVDAISEGRAMWASVRDAVSILVGGNLGEIGFTLAAGLVDGRSPLNPRQLLLVNLLTDVAPAMAIALRPPSPATLESLASEGPDASLGKPLNRDIAARAVVTAVGAGSAWAVARLTGSAERARTVGLLALVGTQLGQTVWSGGLSRPVLTTSLASAAVLAGIVQTPGLSHFFGCKPLGPVGWAIAVGASAAATGAAAGLPRLGERVLIRLRRDKDLPTADAPAASPKLPDGNGAA